MTQEEQDNGKLPQVDEDILYSYNSNSNGATDRRKRQVVELDIGKLKKILKRVEQRCKHSDQKLDEETDSIHVVGYPCTGWEKRRSAKIDEDPRTEREKEAGHSKEEKISHLPGAELGERYVFRHWDAMPMQNYTFKNEFIAATCPRTFRNHRVSEELKQQVQEDPTKEKTKEQLHDALSRAKDKAARLEDEGLEDDIRQLREQVW